MHLFYDSTLNTWKLITEELPVLKPRSFDPTGNHREAQVRYNNIIAALKQNALTVGNAEILDIHKTDPDNLQGEIASDKIYEWPGGYETKEFIRIKDVDLPWTEVVKPKNYQPGEAWESKTVAILTLPEEKTLEEMDNDCANAAKKLIQSAKYINLLAGDEPEVALSNEVFKLRQQLKEREESIKEFMHLTSNWDRYTKADMEAIRDRAKALLDKQ